MADLLERKHADELRGMWQGRVLAHTANRPFGRVVMSVLSHSYDDAMPVLLRVVFPGFEGVTAPFLCSAGKIAKTGHVVADVATKDGKIVKNAAIFRHTGELQQHFRSLADQLKLSDADRRELFVAVRRWLVCDYRLDPTMNPADPEAKRLVLH